MKVINLTLTVLFILFAVVQYNDPDPYIWVPIYLFVAGICYYASKRQFNQTVILVGGIPIALYMIAYIPDFVDWIKMGMPSIVETMKANKSYVELTREFGGLVVCVAVLIFQYFNNHIKK
jgi:hypothetical protein